MYGLTQRLGDYCAVIAGQSPEGKYYNADGKGLPFYQGKKEFGNRHINPPRSWTTKITKIAKAGDILISVRAPVGPINFATEEICIGRGLAAIRPSEDLDKDFLFYYLLSKQDKIKGSEGAVFSSINKSQIENLDFYYVRLEEQKRIVAILDQAFAKIEKARAKTEKNLKNARELFESYLQQVFSQRGEGWAETDLGKEVELLTGFAFKSKEYVAHADSVHLIRGDNVVQGCLRWDGVKRWPKDKVEGYEKYLLAKDDIVLAMDRTWVKAGMKYAKISDSDLPSLLVQRVARLRCLDSLDPDYLYHLIGSKSFEKYVLSIQTGLGVPHISGKQIQSFKFARPEIEKQQSVLRLINQLAQKVSRLTEIYQRKLEDLDQLKKSVLQKAFSGELTNNDAEGAAA